jgi:hypothetical protein
MNLDSSSWRIATTLLTLSVVSSLAAARDPVSVLTAWPESQAFHALHTPVQRDCSPLIAMDADGDGTDALFRLHQFTRLTGALHGAALSEASQRGDRVVESAWQLRRFDGRMSFDVWRGEEDHLLLAGTAPASNGSLSNRVALLGGLDQEILFERSVELLNGTEDVAIVGFRTAFDFDFVASSYASVRAFRSGMHSPLWSVDGELASLGVGRFDVDGDDIAEVVIGASPIVARRLSDGALAWTGNSNGGSEFLEADVTGDGATDLVVIGGEPQVAIYSGTPLALVGSWSAHTVSDATLADIDADGDAELIVAHSGGELVAFDGTATQVRVLASDSSHGRIVAAQFEEGVVLAGLSGGSCVEGMVLRSPKDGAPIAREPMTAAPFDRARVARIAPGSGRVLAYTFTLPGSFNIPADVGVELVDLATGLSTFRSPDEWRWSHFALKDMAIGSAVGASAGEIWTSGRSLEVAFTPWIAVDAASDGAPIAYRDIVELPNRDPEALHLIPQADGSRDRVLLVTTPSTSDASGNFAHWIDATTLNPQGAGWRLVDGHDGASTLGDANGDGSPELVFGTRTSVGVYSLSDGSPLWETPLVPFVTGPALIESAVPATIAIADGRELTLLDAATGDVRDSALLPFSPIAVGAQQGDGDGVFLADGDRLWRYSIDARKLSPGPLVGPRVGRSTVIHESTLDGTSFLMATAESGIWSREVDLVQRIFADSFEP